MADAPTVAHPLVAPGKVARRDYQVAIAHEAGKRNTLVILPTGMGKTVVALLVMADRVLRAPGRVLLLAPTKPLAEQHAAFLRTTFLAGEVCVFTGETSPEERELAWRTVAVVCSTPQVVQNDLVSGRIDLKDVTLLVFDEAHRAVGNYAYVFVADAYRRQRFEGLVLGLTASPGSKAEKIREICDTLGVEGVEVRTEEDADTRPYVQDTNVEWKTVAVPETLRRIATLLREMLDEAVATLRAAGAFPAALRFASKKALLDAQRALQARVQSGAADGETYRALSAQAAALKVNHALELVETQGVGALTSYLDRLESDESKAAKAIRADPRVAEVRRLLADSRVDHPKLRQVAVLLRQQLRDKPDSRIIVFTNYRDMAETLVSQLAAVDGVKPVRFVGQASRGEDDRGLSQKDQVRIVEEFKQGVYNVLVATSVAEEGLDIPATDLVIFYEPVASEIRTIQRRGRTGRRRAGRVIILITKDTRDETYHWAARGKEKTMRREIDALRRMVPRLNASEASSEWQAAFRDAGSLRPTGESTLDDFPPAAPAEAKVTVIADHREFASAVVREMAKAGLVVKPETMSAGDYALSDRVLVERKEAGDFVDSLVDGRLFPQAKALRDACSAPILVIEGDIVGRRVSEEAIWGALAALTADLRVTVFMTRDAAGTARLLGSIARREQQEGRRPVAARGAKGALTDDDRLRFIVEGLPHVSAVLGRRLLAHFGTLRALANASEESLMEVEGVGPIVARDIHRTLRMRYSKKGGQDE